MVIRILSAGHRLYRQRCALWIATMLATGLLAVELAEAAETSVARCAHPPCTATNVIFDTDMYSDIDDMLALAMLNTLQDRGEIKVLAVTIGTDAPFVAPYVDLVNTYYGHGDIPIGMTRGGITAEYFKAWEERGGPWAPNGVSYTEHIAQLKAPNGSPIYPRNILNSSQAPEAVSLLREVLAKQPDKSVVAIQVGYATTLARLLNSGPDRASPLDGKSLVEQKVRLLSTMAGSFDAWAGDDGADHPAGGPDMNIVSDVPSAKSVFAEWPTPIVASGVEIGISMRFPQLSVERHFNYAAHHPIADTYRYTAPAYRARSKRPEAPHDHATFDLTSVLYAARPDEDYFSLSEPGRITALSDGGSRFEPDARGSHRYLILTPEQKSRTLEAMVMLTSQPPVHQAKH